MTIASTAVILVVGIMVRQLGRGPAISVGLGVAALGIGLLAVAEGLDGYLALGIALALVGLGVGVAATLGTDAVVSAVPKARASVSETAYELGVALGIAVLGSLQVWSYRNNLVIPEGIDQAAADATRDSLASAHRVLDLTDPIQVALLSDAQHAFAGGMQLAAVTTAVLLVIAAIVAWRVISSEKEAIQHDAH